MSQRSAFSAAASATAEVSEPPRPSVVMRLSGPMPWKPATTATWPSPKRRSISVGVDRLDARLAVRVVGADRDLPAQPGARVDAELLQRERQSGPLVTCSPVATTTSYSRASCSGAMLARPVDQLVGRAGHGRDHDGDLVAGLDLALDPLGDVRMRSMSATEVPPNFMTIRGIRGCLDINSSPDSVGFADGATNRPGTRRGCRRARRVSYSFEMAEARRLQRRQQLLTDGFVMNSARTKCEPQRRRCHRRSGRDREIRGAWPRNGGTPGQVPPAAPASTRRGSPSSATRLAAHFGRDPLAPRPLDGSAAARYRLRRRAAVASRWRGWAPRSPASTPPSKQHRRRARLHAERSGPRHRLPPRRPPRTLAAAGETLRRRAGARGGRACRRPRRLPRRLRRPAEPGRRAVRRRRSTARRRPSLLAIVGAEYVLRWLPRGTHDWRKFVRPSELAAACAPGGAGDRSLTGVSYNPLRG